MKKIALVLSAVMLTTALSGCAGTVTDQYAQEHPKGVGYYDQAGKYHEATPEAISPKAQDGWETAGWVAVGAASVAALATGIVALTK